MALSQSKRIFICLAVIFFGVFLLGFSAEAREPSFIFSWQASNYSPSWFVGKNITTPQSQVDFSIEVVSQNQSDFGKIVGLSASEVRWYFDDKLYRSGIGLNKLSYPINNSGKKNIDIRVSVNYFDSQSGQASFVDYLTSFYVGAPEVVLDYDGFDKIISNNQLKFTAIPFFFASQQSSLSASWFLNKNKVSGESQNPFSFVLSPDSDLVSGYMNKLDILVSGAFGEGASNSILFNKQQ